MLRALKRYDMSAYCEEVVPEQDDEASVSAESRVGIRLRSFFLLMILILPIILTIIEILTGFFDDTITPTVVPTPTLYGLGYF